MSLRELTKTDKLLLQASGVTLSNKLNLYFVRNKELFWKIPKPFFSSKRSCGNINLVENDEILQYDKKVAEESTVIVFSS